MHRKQEREYRQERINVYMCTISCSCLPLNMNQQQTERSEEDSASSQYWVLALRTRKVR